MPEFSRLNNIGCGILILPFVFLLVIFPLYEGLNDCPHNSAKHPSVRSIGRPPLNCETLKTVHPIFVLAGAGLGVLGIYRKGQRGKKQSIETNDNLSLQEKKDRELSGWEKALLVGGVTLVCNLIIWFSFSTSASVGAIIITAPLSFIGGIFFVFCGLLFYEGIKTR